MIRNSIRCYSSSEKPVFLSDILNRIEKLNISKTRNTETKPQSDKTGNKGKPQQQQQQRRAAPQNQPYRPKEPAVKVQDHPLYSNKFRNMTPNSKPQRSFKSPRPRTGTNNKAPKTTSDTKASRPKMPRSRDTRRKDPFESPTMISKEVTGQDYKPTLPTNSFIYGKSTNFQINLASRITSIAKKQLLKSKYPYMLPKHIIENAPEEVDNKFLLSKSYSLDLDPSNIKEDINSIVKGVSPSLSANSPVANFLNQNPDLSLSQKETMFNIISKPKNLNSLFKDAHWSK